MTRCLSIKRTAQVILTPIPVLLASLVLSGCDQDKYSEDITYPLRSDPFVKETPTTPEAQPTGYDSPGQFPQELIAGLKANKASIVNALLPSSAEAQQLDKLLSKTFGTPAHPKVESIEDDVRKELHLDEQTLAQGSLLYRRHCLHCHGLTGDGRGHTAPWINPHPRDFRRGLFKFTSSSQPQGAARKARRADLLRTLRQGIENTAMPSFGLLADSELEALVSYVIHLSLRGEVEQYAMFQREEKSIDEAFGDALDTYPGRWMETEEKVIQPKSYSFPTDGGQLAASMVRGQQFFATACLSCHENYGRKDVYKYDAWGTVVRPANLTLGNYRGGRRPIDLYYRIHGGINGSAMPENFGALGTEDKVWDVVNFVQALPYPAALPEEVRKAIYPSPDINEVADRRNGQ